LSEAKDWKYYFIKYDAKLHDTNTQGYYYWKNRDVLPLEVIILNSSFESASNLEWNIFNWILYVYNRDNTSLDFHGASSLILFKAGLSINGVQNGFEVKATNDSNNILNMLIAQNINIKDGLLQISDNEDFIVKGQELIDKTNSCMEKLK
jgi:hypothetical protein